MTEQRPNEWRQGSTRWIDLIPHLQVKLNVQDLWIGVYWNFTVSIESSYRRLDVYICIIPVLPIHLRWEWGWR